MVTRDNLNSDNENTVEMFLNCKKDSWNHQTYSVHPNRIIKFQLKVEIKYGECSPPFK